MAAGPAPLFRLMNAGFVLAREGVFALFPTEDLPPTARLGIRIARVVERRGAKRRDAAARLTDALNRLGPSYVKLGQFLATRPDVVGDEAAAELAKLQDEVPPVPDAEAIAAVEAALGAPASRFFVEIGECVAAASIAQVYRARVREPDGAEHDVAVKVLRPQVARRFARDLQSFYMAARVVERFVRPARRLRPVAIVDTLAHSVTFEMDLRLEASALSEMAENTTRDPGFRVPAVDWQRTARTVLTLEWIDGIKLSRVERLHEAGYDLPALARTVIQSFLRQAVRDGFFHADMHQGNLFVEPDGTLVAVDLGITGRLSRAERGFLARILYGFILRDYHMVAEVHFEAGYVPRNQDVDMFAQALRAIGEPIRDQKAQEISMAKLLTQLFEVTELFEMRTQPQLLLLQKTMVVVEGVARSLDPALDMWGTSEPIVRRWMEDHLGPVGRLRNAADGIGAIARLMSEIPDFADRIDRLSENLDRMAAGGVDLSDATVREIETAVTRRSSMRTAALWLAALALVGIAVQLWL